MHHKTPNRNKPRLLKVRIVIFDSKGKKVCIGKKTFEARTLIEKLKCKSKELICTEE